MKKLLMLSANPSEVPLILAAKEQGYYVVTTGNNVNAMGHKYSDEYVKFDYSDYDGMVNLTRKLKIDAVSQGCSDNCALVAAYIGEKLGIKGHDTFENACIIHRKDYFKNFVNQEGIKSPKAYYFSHIQDAMLMDTDGIYPLIVKPTDQAGGKGVECVWNRKEFEKAIQKAFDRSNIGHIVVEPFIEGTLHSLSTFIVDQKVAAYATYNDYSFKNKFMTNAGICPADNWEKAIRILIPETERIAKKLGLVDGLLHMQYIMDKDEPWIIEMMRRTPGNNCTTAASRSTGIDWRDWIIRAEAGEDCHGIPETRISQKIYGYHGAMSASNGVMDRIVIEEEFKKYILEFVEYTKHGDPVSDYLYQKCAITQFVFYSEEEKNNYMKRINEMIWCKLK